MDNSGWVLKKSKDGVTVFTKKNPATNFDLLKTECTLPYKATELLSLITDVESHTKWVYNCILSQPIKIVSETELYYYGETYAPWPVSNRDLILHISATQNPATKRIDINVFSEPEMLPQKEGKVRVPRSHSHWVLIPVKQGVEITYTLDIDPGGNLPAWLVNFASVDGPLLSFEAMKKVLKEKNFKMKKFANFTD